MLPHHPWLKSMIFWVLLVLSLLLVFQCSTRQQKQKPASQQSFERLYSCVRDLNLSQHPAFAQQLQQLHTEATQQELMQLIQQCRSLQPIANKADYLDRMQQQLQQASTRAQHP